MQTNQPSFPHPPPQEKRSFLLIWASFGERGFHKRPWYPPNSLVLAALCFPGIRIQWAPWRIPSTRPGAGEDAASWPVAFLLPKTPVQLQKEPAAACARLQREGESGGSCSDRGAGEEAGEPLRVWRVSVSLFIRDPVNLLGALAPKATVPAAAQGLPPSRLPFLRPAKSVGRQPPSGWGRRGRTPRARCPRSRRSSALAKRVWT